MKKEKSKRIQEQGKCPKCGSENIIYAGSMVESESLGYEASCQDCECDFVEWYNLSYVESLIKGEM